MRRHWAIVLAAWFIACDGDEPTKTSTADTGTTTDSTGDTGDTTMTMPMEECNGKDDDGDGLVDEDFNDVDADGVADCVDTECDIDPRKELPIKPVDECLGPVDIAVADPWDLAVEWQNTKDPTFVMPAIANLSDDNGDASIDRNDIPDIVFVSNTTGEAVALSGDGKAELWRAGAFKSLSGLAVGDIDADGLPEVVGITPFDRVVAYDHLGKLEWESKDTFPMLYPVPTIADLEGDGIPEVVADAGVVSGVDGTKKFDLAGLTTATPWRAPVVADIDLDGVQEIILADTVYSGADGKVLWSVQGSGTSCFSAIGNFDKDDEAEVVFAFGGEMILTEDDGTVITTQPAGATNPGPPCVGDLDGDGDAEIVVPAGNALIAYEGDGKQMWSQPVVDTSGAAGCAVFDMNGDFVYEVIYADEEALRVLDGATGKVQYEDFTHASVTVFEYPVIADVDLDGSAEIITSSSGDFLGKGQTGITVFGHKGKGWPRSGPTWGVHDYQNVNVDADGNIPAPVPAGWLEFNVFRGRPSIDFADLPDLIAEVTDACVASCEPGGAASIAVSVCNQGAYQVDDDVTVSLYALDSADKATFIASETVTGGVASGACADSLFLDLSIDDVGKGGLSVTVDGDAKKGTSAVEECDETNNLVVSMPDFCP